MRNLLIGAAVVLLTLTLAGCASREFEQSPCHDRVASVFGSGLTANYDDLYNFKVSFGLNPLPNGNTAVSFSLKNMTSGPIEVTIATGRFRTRPYVVVTTDAPDCELLWVSPAEQAYLKTYPVAARTAFGITDYHWHRADNEGRKLPHGEYLVHGVLRMRHPADVDLVAFEHLVIEHSSER